MDTALRPVAARPLSAESTPAQPRRWRRPSWPVISALAALVALSSVAHFSALRRDLPIPDIDESYFVDPAVQMAADGDPNPHWFGHPGSTVIYPVAGLLHAWDVVAHDGPLLGANPEVAERYEDDPTEFYVIARVWTIVLSIGSLPLLFLVGRRAFNSRVALIATALWAVLPLPVHFGRIARSDSAGLFFGLLALWLCLRLLDEPRRRWCILAGLSVGVAVSSRFFMVALVASLVAAAVVPRRREPRAALRAAAIAVGSAVGAFVLTTPYLLLDWGAARESLEAENAPLPGADDLSPLGNLRFYLEDAIPDALTWLLVGLAAAGLVLVVRQRRARQLLLVIFALTFLAGICASRLHWQRWIIQILPVLILLAVHAVDVTLHKLAASGPRRLRSGVATPIALVGVTAVLAIHPTQRLLDLNRATAETSTRTEAREWILTHVPPGSRLGDDAANAPLNDPRFVDDPIDPRTDTLAGFREAGYDYLVVSGLQAGRYIFDPERYPRESAFYLDIFCNTRLVAFFAPATKDRGYVIRIYDVEQRPRKLYDVFCTQHVED